jgi:hypothetical protein
LRQAGAPAKQSFICFTAGGRNAFQFRPFRSKAIAVGPATRFFLFLEPLGLSRIAPALAVALPFMFGKIRF